jgi:molybdate transport system ATP-binding protein
VLQADFERRFASFTARISMAVAPGETVVIVGESGAGKSTVLRCLAGLDQPDAGRLAFSETTWFDSSTGQHLAARHRPVGYVSQDYALFPHLTAVDNVAFGLRAAGAPKADARNRARAWLERVGLPEVSHHRPHQLSGGQQQRVALARALVLDPAVLLLDEPLSALDLRTRRAMRNEVQQLAKSSDRATVYVTHDPIEAMTLADRIVVMEGGSVTQIGTRETLVQTPKSLYVGEFLGLNLFEGVADKRDESGLTRVTAGGGTFLVAAEAHPGRVYLVVDPRTITLSVERPAGSAHNVFSGTVREMIPEPPSGDRVRVVLETQPPLVAEVTRNAVQMLALHPGGPVYAAVKATAIRMHA